MSDDAGLKVTVSADVQDLQTGAQQSVQSLQSMEKELNALGRVIDNTVAKGQDISKLEDAYQALTDKIKAARAAAAQPLSSGVTSGLSQDLQSVSAPIEQVKSGVQGLGLTLGQQRTAFIDFGRIVTGQGFSLRSLAANFSLLGPAGAIGAAALYGLYEILNKQTDAEKKAEEQAKQLAATLLNLKSASQVSDEATGSEAGNIDRVQVLAAAIQNTNLSYKERNNALLELRETNKAYFGDLTLEAASLATLTDRVNEYSNALIAEAVVKGQVDAIAKLTSTLLDQVRALDKLKTARDQANAEAAKPQESSAGSVAAGGADALNNTALRAAATATLAYNKQADAVFQIRQQIALYKGDLDNAIAEQIKFKPLQVPPKTKSDLTDIVSILKEVASIYADLSKPQKGPLFILNENSGANLPAGQTSPVVQVIQAQIDAAKKKLADAANDPSLAAAYQKLITALGAKLHATLNPDLTSPVDQALANPADVTKALDQAESKIEKSVGTRGLEIKVPAHLELDIENAGFNEEDAKKIKAELERSPGFDNFFVHATATVQVSIGKGLINQADLRELKKTIDSVAGSTVVAGFKDIGVALGDALSGAKNPLQAAIKDFTSVLGNGLIKIGEQMIAASALMQALKSSLGTLFTNPAAGIFEGIAAVALGEIVKNVGAHAFATGGIVTGPTLGLVGEAGPEVIFPLSQLNRFMQGQPGRGDQNINVRGQISGNNLKLVLARTNKNQGLV